MKKFICIFLCIIFLGHCFARKNCHTNFFASEKTVKLTSSLTNDISEAKPAKVAYIDPITGKLTSKPPENSKILQSKKTTDKTEEANVVKSPVKDGGYMVDLKGQFRQQIIVKKENGKSKKTCTNSEEHKK